MDQRTGRRRASSARSVRLLARSVSSIRSAFVKVMVSVRDTIIVYEGLLQATLGVPAPRQRIVFEVRHADAIEFMGKIIGSAAPPDPVLPEEGELDERRKLKFLIDLGFHAIVRMDVHDLKVLQ